MYSPDMRLNIASPSAETPATQPARQGCRKTVPATALARLIGLAVLGLILAIGSPSHAGRPLSSPRPVFVPWSVAAEADGVEATVGHHAGLGFLDGIEVGFSFALPITGDERATQFSWMLAGALGPLKLGMGYSLFPVSDGIEAMAHRLDIAAAFRISHAWSIGVGWHGLFSDLQPQVDAYETWGISTTVRPLSWLSVALGFDRINTPQFGVDTAPADVRLSIGLRPDTERLAFGISGHREIGDTGGWGVGGSLRAMPVDGFVVGAYARYDRDAMSPQLQRAQSEVLEWGAYIALSQSVVEVQTGVDGSNVLAGDGGSSLTFNTMLKAGTGRRTSLVKPSRRIVELQIGGPIPERVNSGLLGGLLTSGGGAPFAYWLAALDIVAKDPAVSGLLLRLVGPPSWTQCWELRQAMARIRSAGKSVFVHFANGDMKTVYLASAADKVFMHPVGTLMVQGMSITRSYYGDLLSNLGVNAQFIKYAEFKSAPEAFTGNGPSDPAKSQTKSLLSAFEKEWMEKVGQGRKRTSGELLEALKAGPLTADLARTHGLVDGVVADGPGGALQESLTEALGYPAAVVRHYRPSPSAWARWTESRKVAIVAVTGSIVDGTSSQAWPISIPFLGGETTGDRTFVNALMSAVRDPAVMGIVVRVNSGGGAVLASDRMYRAVKKAAETKPLVVSFGNVAASGGYYLAAGAPRILAAPTTVTGSIGIFTGKVDLSELYRKVGISTHTERTLPQADAMGMHRPWTEAEVKRASTRLKSFYDQFVGIVADGRKLNKAAAFERAKGQVYDGKRALDLKLVDAHAGLWDAIQWIRNKAGAAGDPYSIAYLPVDTSFLATLGRLFGTSLETTLSDAVGNGASKRIPTMIEQLAGALVGLKPATVYAQMPYVLEIR